MRDSSSDTDGDRMRRWAAGDRAAFEEIVRAWTCPIGRFLVRLTGDADAASDLTQEVFLRVYLKAAQYRDAGTFRTWLFQIALNLSRDAARRRVRKPAGPDDGFAHRIRAVRNAEFRHGGFSESRTNGK